MKLLRNEHGMFKMNKNALVILQVLPSCPRIKKIFSYVQIHKINILSLVECVSLHSLLFQIAYFASN